MSEIRPRPSFNQLALDLDKLCRELPETLSLDDVQHHPGLRLIVLAADDIAGRIDRRALEWCKMRGGE